MDRGKRLPDLVLIIKGGGEMATGVAWRLFRSGMRRIVVLETENPAAVRRTVALSEAVFTGSWEVEGVVAEAAPSAEEIREIWGKGRIPVLVDPQWHSLDVLEPDVVVDAVLAKRNLGTRKSEAPLVVGLGPGFTAGGDVHLAVETKRGHDLGRVIEQGSPAPNTGVPGEIGGYAGERVLRAPRKGGFAAERAIGDFLQSGDRVGAVEREPVRAAVSGVLRGLLRDGSVVHKGAKLGDIDPRGERETCFTISDKARALGGAVLEAVLGRFNAAGDRELSGIGYS
jgi:xanthine dehydrogenase accessory factor